MKLTRTVNLISKEAFQVFLVTYLLLTLTETVKTGFVSNFFNMNYLLLVVLVAGVAMVLTEETEETLRERFAPQRIAEKSVEKLQPAADWVRQAPATSRRVVRSLDGFIVRDITYMRRPQPRPKARTIVNRRPPNSDNTSTDGFL